MVAECHLRPLRGGANSYVVVLFSSEKASIKTDYIFFTAVKNV